MKYVIGTGYVANGKTPIPTREFFEVWRANTRRWADPQPQHTIVLVSGEELTLQSDSSMTVVPVGYNHGHIQKLAHGSMLGGWSAHVIGCAMLAYNFGADFIYKEQDCLAFGPWVQQLYKDAGQAQVVFGQPLKIYPRVTCTNSLFLVKFTYILQFVRDYLSMGPDENGENMPERKFTRLMVQNPNRYRRMSFGVDRDRPMPIDSKNPWYVQQISAEEYSLIYQKQLL